MRRINILGNEKTKDQVIRRELRQLESSWFAQDKVDQIQRPASPGLSFLMRVDIETPTVPGVSDQVDLNIKVVERNTGKNSGGRWCKLQ